MVSPKKEKEQNMKTIVTLAIIALFAATATAAHTDVITKGGAAKLMKAPTVQTGTPALAAPMNCPKCKSEFVSVTIPRDKSTPPSTVMVERHACPTCVNKWVTIGHGKAKVLTTVHTCGGCKS